jgi:carboxypeptidase C (cathepsin A)
MYLNLLFSFNKEMGPWRPMADGSLKYNPASWATIANMVYLEQPAGVGFSYTTNDAELYTNDYQAASDNLATLHAFYKRFPERQNNTLYLSSESYGGHYMPTVRYITVHYFSSPVFQVANIYSLTLVFITVLSMESCWL